MPSTLEIAVLESELHIKKIFPRGNGRVINGLNL